MIKLKAHKLKDSGFTMIELVVVLGIVAILAALVLPNSGDMIKEYRLRSAARGVVAAVQNLKLKAIKENSKVRIAIRQEGGNYKYIAFMDNNDNDDYDAGEGYQTQVLNDQLTLVSNFPDNEFGFNSRGMPSDGNGTITIGLVGGRTKKIVINTAGNIRVE